MTLVRRSSATLPLVGSFLLFTLTTSLAAPPIEGVAERMTREAIDAGIAGEEQLRAATLARVMEIAPDFAPARWEAGQLKVNGEWMSVSQAQSLAKADPRHQAYATRRADAPDEAASQLELAQWCDDNGLRDEAAYHWWQVLQAAPQHAEALERLELVWFQGELHRRDDVENIRTQQRQYAKALKTWNDRIDRWVRRLAGGDLQQQQIIDEMRDEVDESAIPAFEQLAGAQRGWESSSGTRKIALSSAFLQVMADRQTFAGTQTLVRHALLAQPEEIRTAALAHLPDRPQHETVPLLLDCLSAPIQSRFDIRITPSGRTVYVHELEVEGREADQVMEQTHEGHVVQSGSSTRSRQPERLQDLGRRMAQARANMARSYQRQALAVEQQVAQQNALRQRVNNRVIDVLQRVTGQQLGEDPAQWWAYWQQVNGYDEPPYRPTQIVRNSEYDVCKIPPPCECFVAGTPVWTKTGQQAIETLEPGAQVLCQDLGSGELLFRPVLETTVRQPSPMVQIVTRGEVITATEGHPFWVPNKGWLMARELSPGDRLLAVDGLAEIEAVSAAPNEVAYNLVVAEHANYYVGTKGLLVHDNTPRRPADVSQVRR